MLDVLRKCKDELKTASSDARCRELVTSYTQFGDSLKHGECMDLRAIVKQVDENANSARTKIAELKRSFGFLMELILRSLKR